MKIYKDEALRHFEFWSGARDRAMELSSEELDRIEAELEVAYPDGMDETKINDLFWFEEDTIAEWLGYECWEHLEAEHEGRAWPDEDEEEEEEEEDEDEEE